MEYISEIRALLASPKDIIITSHRNPDGDALGASLALYHYLIQSGHQVQILFPSDYPDFFDWMPDIKRIIDFDNNPDECKVIAERAQIAFYLDFNSIDRIDKLGELLDTLNMRKIMIDHHLYPEPAAEFILSDTTASSTCEMIFDFICALGDRKAINRTIGDCLYTGIVTDTGSFKYSTSPKLFRIVSELLELGVDDYELQDLIANNLNEKQLRLLGHCLHNRMEILPEFKTGIISLTKEDYATFDIQRGDTEGIVNYLLKLREIQVAAFFMEQPTIVKMSFRSKGDFSVHELARQHFKGGGHKNASGGSSFQSLSATLKRFKALLPDYANELNH